MLAVIVCSLFNTATLIGLAAGIVIGFVRARPAVGAALTYAPPTELMVPGSAVRPGSA